MPLSTAVLLGEHTPLATVKRWKSVPSRASRSLFGVFTYGCPWQLRSPQPQSSAKMKTTLGCGVETAAETGRRKTNEARTSARKIVMIGNAKGGGHGRLVTTA